MHIHRFAILAGTAGAMKVPPQREIPDFQISDFYSEVYPNPVDGVWQSFVEANITLKPTEGQAWCYAWNATADSKVISSIGNTSCEADPSIGFSFRGDNETGYTYLVWWNETSHLQLYGSHKIGPDQFSFKTGGNDTQVAYYNGTNDFPMRVSQQMISGMNEAEVV